VHLVSKQLLCAVRFPQIGNGDPGVPQYECGAVAPGEVPSWYSEKRELPPHLAPASVETELKAGNFGVIRSLLRALPEGMEAKVMIDQVINACR